MDNLNEYMREQFERYQKINDSAALEAALKAAEEKYAEEMNKVCYLETIFSSFHFLSFSLCLLLSL